MLLYLPFMRTCIAAGMLVAILLALAVPTHARPSVPVVPEPVRPPAGTTVHDPNPLPLHVAPQPSDSDFWRAIRRGQAGRAVIPDPLAARLVQSEGDNWRTFRNGPYLVYTAWFLAVILVLLAVFFLLRGRIRVRGGRSGIRVPRFSFFERTVHWLTAISFVVLAITGLNLIYGRTALMPLVGKPLYAQLTMWGKLGHNYLAFAFMIGIGLMFLQWVWFNLPSRYDVIWILKAGGIFGGHAPAKKFNAGQKIVFWLVVLGGAILSLTGLELLFPYQFHFFEDVFRTLNGWFGLALPTGLSPLQEQQLASLTHGVVAVFMIGVILAHIYIGTLGMEGAFEAMWEGAVDLNWAREHHDLWVEELQRRGLVPQAAE